MPTGQEIPLEPAMAEVLAEHLHDAAVRREVIVDVERSSDEAAILDLEDVAETVRVRLVGTEEAEVGLGSAPKPREM